MYGDPQNSNPSSWKQAVGETDPRDPALQNISPSMYGNGSASMSQSDQTGLGSNRIPPIQMAQNAQMPVGLTSSQGQQSTPVAVAQSPMFNDKQSGMVTPMPVFGVTQQSMATQPQQRQASRMVS